MKKKKLFLAVMATAVMSVAALALSSCTLPDPRVVFPFLYADGNTDSDGDGTGNGGGSGSSAQTAALTGYYSSNKSIVWQNMLPTYNYYFMVITEQSIETYDDMTYCLTVTSQMFSNVHYGPEYYTDAEDVEKQATHNERAHVITRYYGTYTEVNSSKSSVTVSLGVPTRIFYAKQGEIYYDTANWTDKMGAELAGADGVSMTAEAFLTSKLKTTVYIYDDEGNVTGTEEADIFPSGGTEVYIKTNTCSFEAIEILIAFTIN